MEYAAAANYEAGDGKGINYYDLWNEKYGCGKVELCGKEYF